MTRARFWSLGTFFTTLFDPWTGPTALETAAMTGSLEIWNLTVDAHPDINWWLADSSACSIRSSGAFLSFDVYTDPRRHRNWPELHTYVLVR